MRRKKADEKTIQNTNEPVATPPVVDEIEGQPATPPAADQNKKEWVNRPDPFGVETIRWQDGYRVSMIESDSNREIFIRFGSGSKDDAPKNFEAIKTMFKEQYRLYWDPKVQGWAKEIRPGYTPLIKEQNRRVRSEVEEAYYKAVAMEETARGPSLSEHGKHRSQTAL